MDGSLAGQEVVLLVVYMIERQTMVLGLAVPLIAAIALHMPTVSSLTHWIEEQLRLVDEERSMVR